MVRHRVDYRGVDRRANGYACLFEVGQEAVSAVCGDAVCAWCGAAGV